MKKHAATIVLFSQGGRNSDYLTDWARLQLLNADAQMEFGCEIRSIDNSILTLGKQLRVEIGFFNEVESIPFVKKNAKFRLFEGSRHIGNGIWGESIAQNPLNK